MIYLDNNATTEPLPPVKAEMIKYLTETWGNPSSAHSFGLDAKAGMDRARRAVGLLVGSESDMVIFTGSATEAINTALLSALKSAPGKRRIVTAATEHSAVITFGRAREQEGYELVLVPPLKSGVVDLEALARAINSSTAIVSIMWANNETGVINPVEEVAALCRQSGVPFLCDAVQAAGKVSIDLRRVQIDYLALSAHKIHGPKGVGALIVSPHASYSPMLLGGHQEMGRRGGTENVHGVMGFAMAASLAIEGLGDRARHCALLRDHLEARVSAEIAGIEINGADTARLPNTSNIGFSGVDSDTLVAMLDHQGICVSSGSACLSDAVAPSHVILAMTGSFQKASEAIRFSFSHLNTMDEVYLTLKAIKQTVSSLRHL